MFVKRISIWFYKSRNLFVSDQIAHRRDTFFKSKNFVIEIINLLGTGI